jgi:molybdate transport system substrate-binding protein
MVKHFAKFFTICFAIAVCCSPVLAGEKLLAAVAANFILPSQELAEMFEEQTGIKIDTTYTSTGKLYGQIINGAPYDIFFAADEKRPRLLNEQGLADTPFVYAQGQVVVWSAKKALCEASSWQETVKSPEIKKIAIANTESAPYGTAAMIALQKAGLWDMLAAKFVFPQTVAQAFQYAATKSADIGFCAYSSALSEEAKGGCFYKVKEAPPIVQAACILKRTERRSAVEKFAAFMSSPEAQKVKEKYGYR